MIVRLVYRNMKRSISDYMVYFVTLVTGVCLFYTFCAVADQTVVAEMLMEDRTELTMNMNAALPFINVIVTVVLALLVVYANNFLIRHRKKEFGIYMILGMGKGRVAGILLAETVCVGVISFVAGVLAGIVLSQGVSVFTVKLFEADMSSFAFHVSGAAIWKTMCYFFVLYAIVLVLNWLVVGKMRLTRLLTGGQRAEWNTVRNPVLCLVVFLAAAALLGHTYYIVVEHLELLRTPEAVFTQIGKVAVATVLIFWALSGLLLFLARLRKKFYFRGIHAFTARQIGGMVNTNAVAGSIVCLLMFLAISVLATCFSVGKKMNDNLKKLVPADVAFSYSYWPSGSTPFGDRVPSGVSEPAGELFQKAGIDAGIFEDTVEITVYLPWDGEDYYSDHEDVFANTGKIIGITDYNKLAGIYGFEKYTLADDEYIVVANYPYTASYYNREYLSKNHPIRLGDREYHPKYSECRDGFLRMNYLPDELGYTVVPDTALSNEEIRPYEGWYIANYRAEDETETERIEAYLKSDAFYEQLFGSSDPEDWDLWGEYKTDIYRQSVGVASMLVFIGFYLGIIFFIASAALFSMKELSQAVDQQPKYELLRKLGVDGNMLRRSLLCQNAIFFGCPLLLGVLHSIFGMRALSELVKGLTSLAVGTEFRQAMAAAAVMLLAVYLVYFAVTYRCSRNIMEERGARNDR